MCGGSSECRMFLNYSYRCECPHGEIYTRAKECKNNTEGSGTSRFSSISSLEINYSELHVPAPPLEDYKTFKGTKGVHVVACVDRNHLSGVPNLINSVAVNSQYPENIFFHVVTDANDAVLVERAIACRVYGDNTQKSVNIVVHYFDTRLIRGLYKVYTPANFAGKLSSSMNFARFYLPKLIPNIPMLIYVDVDIIFQDDVIKLWKEAKQKFQDPSLVFTVVPRASSGLTERVKQLFTERSGVAFEEEKFVQFNAGLYAFRVDRWQKLLLTREAEFWMAFTLHEKLWEFGTQPILWLLSYGRVAALSSDWNIEGLGWREIPLERVASAKVLHWCGKHKPWEQSSKHKELWEKYTPHSVC
ncbi:uncharacterized protein LOC135120276 [Zophobas morio]|uniref:uncharacterized protein LOC135120276 n=1 Tax=Zophobas morio TaxID=2755281 RepID=UPI003083279B